MLLRVVAAKAANIMAPHGNQQQQQQQQVTVTAKAIP